MGTGVGNKGSGRMRKHYLEEENICSRKMRTSVLG